MSEPKFVPVFQGESRVSGCGEEVLTTILGSCVAACVWDPDAAVGGINHFLLPGTVSDRGGNLRYGVNAMELLINELLKIGAHRGRLRVKLLGGAKMIGGGAEIGAKNAAFAKWYMDNEGIEIAGSCLGGHRGRKIRFRPHNGRVQRSFLSARVSVDVARDASATDRMTRNAPKQAGHVELF